MRLSVFGDSICVGQYVSTHETWVTDLARQVNADEHVEEVIVQNAGVNGNTTRLALERLSYDVLSHRPQIVYVQFGMNDANRWLTDFGQPRVSEDSFKANLLEVARKISACGSDLILLATNHPAFRKTSSGEPDTQYNLSCKRYNVLVRAAFHHLSQEPISEKIRLIDNEQWWFDRGIADVPSLEPYLLDDGVHLSKLGHSEYSQFVVPQVVSYVRDLQM